MEKQFENYARPHPGPLPEGEGEPFCSSRSEIRSQFFEAPCKIDQDGRLKHHFQILQQRRNALPLPEERAEERASITSIRRERAAPRGMRHLHNPTGI